MNYKVVLIFLFTINPFAKVYAQSYQKTDSGIRIGTDSLDVDIQFFRPEIVRVIKSPKNHVFTKESLSVIKTPEQTEFSLKLRKGIFNIKSKKIMMIVDQKSGDVTYYSPSGTLLLKEKTDGARFTPFNDAGSRTFTVSQSFVLDKDEAIYGLGQQQQGKWCSET